MKARHVAACARCGNAAKHRWIDDLLRWRMYRIGIDLCVKCYDGLMQADARAWAWFRGWRERY
ncbi:MAG: hypothetical protein WBY93_00115 [Candidatus Binatus sp.]